MHVYSHAKTEGPISVRVPDTEQWDYALDFGYGTTIYLSQDEADELFSRLNLAMLAVEAERVPEIASAKELEELNG